MNMKPGIKIAFGHREILGVCEEHVAKMMDDPTLAFKAEYLQESSPPPAVNVTVTRKRIRKSLVRVPLPRKEVGALGAPTIPVPATPPEAA